MTRRKATIGFSAMVIVISATSSFIHSKSYLPLNSKATDPEPNTLNNTTYFFNFNSPTFPASTKASHDLLHRRSKFDLKQSQFLARLGKILPQSHSLATLIRAKLTEQERIDSYQKLTKFIKLLATIQNKESSPLRVPEPGLDTFILNAVISTHSPFVSRHLGDGISRTPNFECSFMDALLNSNTTTTFLAKRKLLKIDQPETHSSVQPSLPTPSSCRPEARKDSFSWLFSTQRLDLQSKSNSIHQKNKQPKIPLLPQLPLPTGQYPSLNLLATPIQTTGPKLSWLETQAQTLISSAFCESNHYFGPNMQYQIIAIAGLGGNGAVLSAKDCYRNTKVAIKVVAKQTIGLLHHFPNEFCILRDLMVRSSWSPSILRMLGAWEDRLFFYLVTELVESPNPSYSATSGIYIQSMGRCIPYLRGSADMLGMVGQGPIQLHLVKSLFLKCVFAVQTLHNCGYYHGDIKLSNFLVDSGAEIRVLLADFGFTQELGVAPEVYGTPQMTAPEFLRGFGLGKKSGVKADVFALGLVLFQLLSPMRFVPKIQLIVQTGGIDFAGMQNISEDGMVPLNSNEGFEGLLLQDLLNGLLQVNPAKRFDLLQILAHPWLV
ncbi:kinase-like protein [Rhizoclosmatium globosum]|uniref:Kinase-like protein n=1 Tax=Rhizoclosmatium globosum TaxID=329046 RepID=A0A1Y2D078_9FUNG|nr:kinase-like protein [Rhizoclosmatium globosum]|eukprot:ORY52683.1 kinase-like protein [Rhizoclosmatium globosum]